MYTISLDVQVFSNTFRLRKEAHSPLCGLLWHTFLLLWALHLAIPPPPPLSLPRRCNLERLLEAHFASAANNGTVAKHGLTASVLWRASCVRERRLSNFWCRSSCWGSQRPLFRDFPSSPFPSFVSGKACAPPFDPTESANPAPLSAAADKFHPKSSLVLAPRS